MGVSLKNYLMEYAVYGKDGKVLKEGKIQAKNKESEFAAKAGFGAHIEKKYGDQLGRLWIKSCKVDFNIGDLFGGNMEDIFGPRNKNPFGDIFGGR